MDLQNKWKMDRNDIHLVGMFLVLYSVAKYPTEIGCFWLRASSRNLWYTAASTGRDTTFPPPPPPPPPRGGGRGGGVVPIYKRSE